MVKLGENWEEYRRRGEITYYELSSNILAVCRNTAWCEQEGVRKIVEEKFLSIKMYYRKEKPGYGVYYANGANGEHFPEGYYPDSYVDDSGYFTTIKEAAGHVLGATGGKVESDKNTIKEALDEHMEELDGEDVRHSFHEPAVVGG